MSERADEGSTSKDARSGGGFRRSLIYFSTVALGQGMAFLLLPFITRALTPEAYGAYALALAISTFVGMFASSWIRNVALRLYFDVAERGVTRGFFLGTSLLQVAFFSALYGGTLVAFALFGAELAPLRVMISAGVAMVAGDLAVHTLTLLRAEQRTAPFAIAEIGGGLARFAFTLIGLALGFRSAELLFDASSAGYLLASAYAVPMLWRRLEGPVRIDGRGTMDVLRLGPASLPFSVADWVERLADRLVIEVYLGTAAVGVYSVGYTIGERIIGTLVKAVFMMAWPDILAAWKDGGPRAARAAVRRAHTLYAWFTIGPTVFMVVHGGDLLRLIAGEAYHGAADLVPVIAASMWLGGFASYLNRHLELDKRFGRLSGIRAFGAAVNLGLNVWWVPLFGMMGAAWATMVNRLLNAVVFFVIRDRQLVALPLGSLAAALGVSLAAWGTSALLPGGPLLGMAAFVTLYAPVALLAMRRMRD